MKNLRRYLSQQIRQHELENVNFMSELRDFLTNVNVELDPVISNVQTEGQSGEPPTKRRKYNSVPASTETLDILIDPTKV